MKNRTFKAAQFYLCLLILAAMASGCIWWGPRGYRERGPRVGGEVIIEGGHDGYHDHDRGRYHDHDGR